MQLTLCCFAVALVHPAAVAPLDPAMSNLKPIEIETTVRASLPDVWNAWTTNAGAQKWFAPKANIELKQGGLFEILFLPDQPASKRGAENLRVLSYVPMEMLSFEWNAPPQFPKARAQRTWVVVRFADLGNGQVRVRLGQYGFAEKAAAHPDQAAEWIKTREYFAQAWPRVLENLRKHFDESAPEAEGGPIVAEAIIDAPVDAVWRTWTTKQGLESCVVARAEIDLKVGGRWQSHYDPKGVIGDPNTIENIILAYEPQRMLTLKVGKPPEKFPFKEAVKNMWTVLYFEPLGADKTRLRCVGIGFSDDEESKKLRAFFEQGNAYTIKRVQEHFAKELTLVSRHWCITSQKVRAESE